MSIEIPPLLKEIVSRVEYRPDWPIYLEEHDGALCLCVVATGYNSYHPERGETYSVLHTFQVPPATYNEQSWTRWVLDQCIKVEVHEACEFFKLRRLERDEDGEVIEYDRPFAPNHGPGWDPYQIRELNSVEHAETSFRGVHQPGTQRG